MQRQFWIFQYAQKVVKIQVIFSHIASAILKTLLKLERKSSCALRFRSNI